MPEYYNSDFTGPQIDAILANAVRGDVDQLVGETTAAQEEWREKARNNIAAASADDLTDGLAEKQDALTLPLSIANGGTGASTADGALINLTDDITAYTDAMNDNQLILMKRPLSRGVTGLTYSTLASRIWSKISKTTTPVEGSAKAITSGAVFSAIQAASAANSLVLQAFPQDIAAGQIANFPDGADGIPIVSMLVDLPVTQAGSGTPSPDNVRAITGFTGITVMRAGANIVSSVTWTEGYYYNDNGGTSSSNITKLEEAYIPVVPGTTYLVYISSITSSARIRIHEYNSSKTWKRQKVSDVSGTGNYKGQFETSSDAAFIRFSIPRYCGTVILARGEEIKELDWSGEEDVGAVYAGTLDVAAGVFSATHVLADLGDLTWTKSSSGYFYTKYQPFPNIAIPTASTAAADIYCDHLTSKSQDDLANLVTGICVNSVSAAYPGGIRIYWPASASMTAAEVKTAVTGWKILYPLATPAETQISDAAELSTVRGENNIWADIGSGVSVIYRADPSLFIRRLTGADSDYIADSSIANGSYFMVGNSLYIATTGISAGETIVPGSNCTQLTLADALNALNS